MKLKMMLLYELLLLLLLLLFMMPSVVVLVILSLGMFTRSNERPNLVIDAEIAMVVVLFACAIIFMGCVAFWPNIAINYTYLFSNEFRIKCVYLLRVFFPLPFVRSFAIYRQFVVDGNRVFVEMPITE